MKNKSVNDNNCIKQFTNCHILKDHNIIVDDLLIRNGTILNPEKVFFDEKDYADVKINCRGCLLAPGSIDVQINGGFGVDFSVPHDRFYEDILNVSRGLLAHGVTSYCPTIVTSPSSVYKEIITKFPKFEDSKRTDRGANILGLHLEGPFISKEKKGAHPVEYISEFPRGMQDVLDMYGSLDNVSLITLAPELPNAMAVIKGLTERGIKVSLGHSMANLAQGEKAVQAGATFITHLFNAMLPFHHRDPHLVGLLASSQVPEEKPVFYGMISDGIHTHPAALRMARRISPEGLVIVTDAVPAMGLPYGTHTLGQMKVQVSEKGAYIANTNTLCGSIANMNESVKYFYKHTECTRVEALECATLHPAQMLGIENTKGTLNHGADADLVLLDTDFSVQATYLAGDLAWQSPSYEPASSVHVKKD